MFWSSQQLATTCLPEATGRRLTRFHALVRVFGRSCRPNALDGRTANA